MRIDLFMVALAIILITAMALTLLFGKERGRHGYGLVIPCARAQLIATQTTTQPLDIGATRFVALRTTPQNRVTFLRPCVNPAI